MKFEPEKLHNATMIHPYDVYELIAPLNAAPCQELGYVEESINSEYIVKRRVFAQGDKVYIETCSVPYKSTYPWNQV